MLFTQNVYKKKGIMLNRSNCDRKSQLSGILTEPLNSHAIFSFILIFPVKKCKTYLFIFGTDVELLDLATFITSITHSLCTGYLLTEITSDVAAYLPLEKFEHLTLSTEGFG